MLTKLRWERKQGDFSKSERVYHLSKLLFLDDTMLTAESEEHFLYKATKFKRVRKSKKLTMDAEKARC